MSLKRQWRSTLSTLCNKQEVIFSKGKNNASKQLYNSLNYEVKQNRTSGGQFATGYNAEFFMEEYGTYQDMGVHGAKSSYIENKKISI